MKARNENVSFARNTARNWKRGVKSFVFAFRRPLKCINPERCGAAVLMHGEQFQKSVEIVIEF